MSATLGVEPGAAVGTDRPRARSDRLGATRRAGPGRPHGRRSDPDRGRRRGHDRPDDEESAARSRRGHRRRDRRGHRHLGRAPSPRPRRAARSRDAGAQLLELGPGGGRRRLPGGARRARSAGRRARTDRARRNDRSRSAACADSKANATRGARCRSRRRTRRSRAASATEPARSTGSADALIESFPDLEGQLLDYEGRAVLPLRSDRGVLGVALCRLRAGTRVRRGRAGLRARGRRSDRTGARARPVVRRGAPLRRADADAPGRDGRPRRRPHGARGGARHDPVGVRGGGRRRMPPRDRRRNANVGALRRDRRLSGRPPRVVADDDGDRGPRRSRT